MQSRTTVVTNSCQSGQHAQQVLEKESKKRQQLGHIEAYRRKGGIKLGQWCDDGIVPGQFEGIGQ